jgi:hypothetical protein
MKVASATGSSKVLRATFIKPKLRNPRNIPAKQKFLPRIPENLIERFDFVRFGRVEANMNGPSDASSSQSEGPQSSNGRGQKQNAQLNNDWTSHPLPRAIRRDILINVT